jgi:hypothetical protein
MRSSLYKLSFREKEKVKKLDSGSYLVTKQES